MSDFRNQQEEHLKGFCLSVDKIVKFISKNVNNLICFKKHLRGAWVAHSVTSAQVMISPFMGSSPTSGSVLTAQSLEPASDSASLRLSLPLPHLLSVSVSQKGIKTLKKNPSNNR